MSDFFPGGSKARVNLAGNRIRDKTATDEDYLVFDDWRLAHRAVLNTFQAILRNKTRGESITVAQRHKRRSTIINKLQRFPEMQLSRMDDIAGCRLIFSSIEELYKFREIFHKSRFDHILKNDIDKYDYIKNPKLTGYRGIHDIYEYNVRSKQGKYLRGLKVEIQYRTLIQHAWATTVELIGFLTESQPKFQQGDKRYENIMILTSEIIARAHENKTGPLPDISNDELVNRFYEADTEIGLMKMLNNLNSRKSNKSKNKNAILIYDEDGMLIIKTFETAPQALKELFKLELESKYKDIVLVRADTNDEIRLAYRNYFSDAKDFIDLIQNGCNKLTKKI